MDSERRTGTAEWSRRCSTSVAKQLTSSSSGLPAAALENFCVHVSMNSQWSITDAVGEARGCARLPRSADISPIGAGRGKEAAPQA